MNWTMVGTSLSRTREPRVHDLRARGRARARGDTRVRGEARARAVPATERTTTSRLAFGPRDVVVVTGLPGGGKSTLMRRAAAPGARIDSQDTRDRWDRRMPRFLPYAVYRPLVRLAHYARLRRALRSGEGVVVHDCGTQSWVRGWLARAARRRGAALHLVLLDVPAEQALRSQRSRGRTVSSYAFRRHRRAVGRLITEVERGVLPPGCASAVLLDRRAADAVRTIGLGEQGSDDRAGGTAKYPGEH